MRWRHLLVPGLFLVSLAVAQVDVNLAQWSPVLLPFLYIALRRAHPGGRLAAAAGSPPDQAARLPASAHFWRVVAFVPLIGFIAWSIWVRLHR